MLLEIAAEDSESAESNLTWISDLTSYQTLVRCNRFMKELILLK